MTRPAPTWTSPTQHRSAETLERLFSAAEAFIEAHGFHALELRGLCEAAGVTTGAFYRRFSGKDAMLDVLFDRFEASGAAVVAAFVGRVQAGAFAGRRELLAAFVAALSAVYRDRGGLIRALIEASSSRPAYRARALATIDRAARVLEASLAAVGEPAPPAAARFVTRLVFAWLDHRLLFVGQAGRGADRPEADRALLAALAAGLHAWDAT